QKQRHDRDLEEKHQIDEGPAHSAAMLPLAAGTRTPRCPVPTEDGEERDAAVRGPRRSRDRPPAGGLEGPRRGSGRGRQPRRATGASVNAVMRCRSETRPAISSAVSRVTRSVPNSSTLYEASAVPYAIARGSVSQVYAVAR